jgi:NAD(P)H-hydrate repair Nnr-like enzyme with NAD(P)H-hydrate epimerase domain
MTDHAARAIAQLMVQIVGGNRRFTKQNFELNGKPYALIIAGVQRTNSPLEQRKTLTAIMLARWLAMRQFQVKLILTGYSESHSTEEQVLVDRVAQLYPHLDMINLKSLGRNCLFALAMTGRHEIDLQLWDKSSKMKREVPDVIVDAMDCVSSKTSEWPAGWIRYCNEAKAPVLSIEVPTGMNAMTGRCLNDDVSARGSFADLVNEPAESVDMLANRVVRAKYTVAIGLPLQGLIQHKMRQNNGVNCLGEVFLVDDGIGTDAYRDGLGDSKKSPSALASPAMTSAPLPVSQPPAEDAIGRFLRQVTITPVAVQPTVITPVSPSLPFLTDFKPDLNNPFLENWFVRLDQVDIPRDDPNQSPAQ